MPQGITVCKASSYNPTATFAERMDTYVLLFRLIPSLTNSLVRFEVAVTRDRDFREGPLQKQHLFLVNISHRQYAAADGPIIIGECLSTSLVLRIQISIFPILSPNTCCLNLIVR